MKNYLKIDFEIFQDKRLNTTDIILLYYFSSFEKCFTSNATIEKTFGITERMIQYTIRKLKRLEYIKVKENKKGKKREITSRLYNPNKYKRKVIDLPDYLKEEERKQAEELTPEERKQAEELAKRVLNS